MGILILLLACIVSGILYRMGGSDKYDTLWRDLGCPGVMLVLVYSLFGFDLSKWWAYLLFFGLSWGALSTYLDSIFGYDNFYAHGFLCGLAGASLLCCVSGWILLVRLIICTFGMGWWSKGNRSAVLKEFGRGVFFIL